MPKRIAILQSNYIPWKGYFDLIGRVDEFILLDGVQYTRNDWRNRNKIKTWTGTKWLTIPIQHHFGQRIDQAEASDVSWHKKHWSTIAYYYAKAKYFPEYREQLAALYSVGDEKRLSQINYRFLTGLCPLLGISTRISHSSDYAGIPSGQTERLIALCNAAGAGGYLSGPAARAYIDEEQFKQARIVLSYMDYSGYPEYAQLYPPFDHAVSVLDLLLCEGPDAPRYMKSESWISRS